MLCENSNSPGIERRTLTRVRFSFLNCRSREKLVKKCKTESWVTWGKQSLKMACSGWKRGSPTLTDDHCCKHLLQDFNKWWTSDFQSSCFFPDSSQCILSLFSLSLIFMFLGIKGLIQWVWKGRTPMTYLSHLEAFSALGAEQLFQLFLLLPPQEH